MRPVGDGEKNKSTVSSLQFGTLYNNLIFYGLRVAHVF